MKFPSEMVPLGIRSFSWGCTTKYQSLKNSHGRVPLPGASEPQTKKINWAMYVHEQNLPSLYKLDCKYSYQVIQSEVTNNL